MKICIDPGHGGYDPGAVGKDPYELREKEVVLSCALTLRNSLMQHHVHMTRDMDVYVPLASRARFANIRDCDLFVSIHANSAANRTAEGIETFHYEGSKGGKRLATDVQQEMILAFPDHKDRGVKTANFAVLRLTRMPAILVELEFLSNPGQLVFLDNDANLARAARAIKKGIERWTT